MNYDYHIKLKCPMVKVNSASGPPPAMADGMGLPARQAGPPCHGDAVMSAPIVLKKTPPPAGTSASEPARVRGGLSAWGLSEAQGRSETRLGFRNWALTRWTCRELLEPDGQRISLNCYDRLLWPTRQNACRT